MNSLTSNPSNGRVHGKNFRRLMKENLTTDLVTKKVTQVEYHVLIYHLPFPFVCWKYAAKMFRSNIRPIRRFLSSIHIISTPLPSPIPCPPTLASQPASPSHMHQNLILSRKGKGMYRHVCVPKENIIVKAERCAGQKESMDSDVKRSELPHHRRRNHYFTT